MKDHCSFLMLMLDQAEGFRQFHHDDWNQGKSKSKQIGFPRKNNQPKSNPHRCKQDEGNQEKRDKAGPVQLVVGEETDFEQGMIRAHIIRLDNLGQGQDHKGEGLAAG